MTALVVGVVGPGDTSDDRLCAAAYDVGAALARAGCDVLTGGLGGVMAAACRGAAEAGGRTIGLLPGTDPTAANPWVQVAVPTGLGEARNVLVARAAAGLVAVGGSWGTLSEIALARRCGKPVVAVHGWAIDGPSPGDGVLAATDAREAAATILAALRG